MLQRLRVRDFAIVDRIEVDFHSGFTVVTGETGAGKSLIVDALGLIAGARGDSAWVRHGADRAEIEAEFSLDDAALAARWLLDRELDDPEAACRLRRTLRADGGGRAYVNDRAVSLASLRELASMLLEIHGQHEHQVLLDRREQLALLDAVAGHADLSAVVVRCAQCWRDGEVRLAEIVKMGTGDPALQDLLEFQAAELESLTLDPAAIAQTESDHRRLAHAVELIDGARSAQSLLDGGSDHAGGDDNGAVAQVARAETRIDALKPLDPELAPLAAALAQASAALADASVALARYLDRQELDSGRLSDLDEQLGQLHSLARKHRVRVDELASVREGLRERLDTVRDAEGALARQREHQSKARGAWREAAAILTRSRLGAAKTLAADAQALMRRLGMPAGQFELAIETDSERAPSTYGADTIEFEVSANAGQPMRPLRKVASGGELSRIALALQVAAKGQRPAPTLIFDEVDSGIGGAVAEIVGRLLGGLADASQVLCVTHLPQVAAQADHHMLAAKAEIDGKTLTSLGPLDPNAREIEIARMLGGITVGNETVAHARQMLAAGAKNRSGH